MAVNLSQSTVYCDITFFYSYPGTLIPSIPSLPFVTDDDEVLLGECTATEFLALIRGAMDIESMTRTTTWTTTTAAQSRQRMVSTIPQCQKILSSSSLTSSSLLLSWYVDTVDTVPTIRYGRQRSFIRRV